MIWIRYFKDCEEYIYSLKLFKHLKTKEDDFKTQKAMIMKLWKA